MQKKKNRVLEKEAELTPFIPVMTQGTHRDARVVCLSFIPK
jgi:hypothetical protein